MKSTKKTAAKSTTTSRRATLEARAEAIIADAKGYDADTRRAVEISLDDLRETVRIAERGGMIADTTDLAFKNVPLSYTPLESSPKEFEQYKGDGVFFAHLLANPATPKTFRDLFAAVFSDVLMGGVADELGQPNALPVIYPIVRDILDASNAGGAARGAYDSLILAVETLVPEEVSDAAREAKGGVS
jgi:hypothetical protein